MYRQNMTDMVMSPAVRAQKPKILLISAPPPRDRTQEVDGRGKIRDEDTALQYAQELQCACNKLRTEQVYMYDLCTAVLSATESGDRSKFYARDDGKCPTTGAESL
jgi:hypothetical protein